MSRQKNKKLWNVKKQKQKVVLEKKPMLTQEEQAIKSRAECLWRLAGRPEGDDDYFWLMAENELKNEKKIAEELVKQQREKRDFEHQKNREEEADKGHQSIIAFYTSFGLGLISFAIICLLGFQVFSLTDQQKVETLFVIAGTFSIGLWIFLAGCLKAKMRNSSVHKCQKCEEVQQQSKLNKALEIVKRFNVQEDLFNQETEDLFTKN